ncbi:PH domain-containing protein [Amycolatopsis magusensis]|uniref:PH domain-containing protein n=1 Tax=Amycolatopsis magusensis TaxID=882444 RepID=UPI0024AA0198|nr:PH domain-containing protein [Amycolatopsis magusensis]MDI5981341.1 PH domain-containing protein [Amycolatopsis magusensis]
MSGTVRLRPPSKELNPRVIGWWRVHTALTFGIPVLVLVVLGVWLSGARFWLLLPAVVLAVIGLPFTVLMPLWWYRVHRWEVTDTAVYVRTGYFWQEWRVAPMSRIQTVDTLRGPLQQGFQLATVTVTTASSKGPIKIEGLDHELAADLAQQLTETTQATPGDAT